MSLQTLWFHSFLKGIFSCDSCKLHLTFKNCFTTVSSLLGEEKNNHRKPKAHKRVIKARIISSPTIKSLEKVKDLVCPCLSLFYVEQALYLSQLVFN